jgi:serine/threonine protein kinase
MAPSPHHYCEICGVSLSAQRCAVCEAMQAMPFLENISLEILIPHTLFRDRYDILDIIGEGGYGSVYKARDTLQHNRFVAIKELRLDGLSVSASAEASDAFQREVHLLSQLTHPALPHICEHFQLAERWYIVMEFIAGQTLEEYLYHEPLRYIPLSEILHIGIQLCTVLAYLHAQEPPIIFRDLKPSNIMRTPPGKIYVIDFGIARRFKPGKPRDTIALGSPGYAAPEQYGRAQTTPRADIYSLGVVLYQLLTRKDPGESPFNLPPLHVNSNLSICELASLVNQMIMLDVNLRPENITHVKQELEHITRIWQAINLSFWQPGLQYIR